MPCERVYANTGLHLEGMIPTNVADRIGGWRDTLKSVWMSPRQIAELVVDLHEENEQLRRQQLETEHILLSAHGRTIRAGETHHNIPGDIDCDDTLWVNSTLSQCTLTHTGSGVLHIGSSFKGSTVLELPPPADAAFMKLDDEGDPVGANPVPCHMVSWHFTVDPEQHPHLLKLLGGEKGRDGTG